MPQLETILSNTRADRIRRVRELSKPKVRAKTGLMLVEGPQCVREIVEWSPTAVRDIYVSTVEGRIAGQAQQRIVESALEHNLYVHLCTAEVLEAISPNAQGIAAVAVQKDVLSSFDALEGANRIAALWQVRDPGNCGTVIRSCDAAGFDAVMLVDESVDITNPKVIRSSVGSLFHIPVVYASFKQLMDWKTSRQAQLIAADVYGSEHNPAISLPQLLQEPEINQSADESKLGLLFGNEARGLPEELIDRADRVVTIPIYGKAESLNLATSASVLLYSIALHTAGK